MYAKSFYCSAKRSVVYKQHINQNVKNISATKMDTPTSATSDLGRNLMMTVEETAKFVAVSSAIMNLVLLILMSKEKSLRSNPMNFFVFSIIFTDLVYAAWLVGFIVLVSLI